MDLIEQFTLAIEQLDGAASSAAQAAQDVLQRWDEPHRAYHDRAHLRQVLLALEELSAPVAPIAVLAAWFHDAVHDGVAGADEESSALLAEGVLRELGVSEPTAAEVARLVRLTTTHRAEAADALGALLIDADLSILAAPPQDYERYRDAVRREYQHLDDDTFRAGRSAVLHDLLQRPTLFYTERGRALWQDQARVNLSAEIEQLRDEEGADPLDDDR